MCVDKNTCIKKMKKKHVGPNMTMQHYIKMRFLKFDL